MATVSFLQCSDSSLHRSDSSHSQHSGCQHCCNPAFPSQLPSRSERSQMFDSIKRKLSRKAPSPPPQTSSRRTENAQPTLAKPQSAHPDSAPPPYSLHDDGSAKTSRNTSVSASAGPSTARTSISAAVTAPEPQDDPYAFLTTFDTLFLIDDSSSMRGSRWSACAAALSSIAPICTKHDTDGIDILFLNAATSPHHSNVRSAAAVADIFASVVPYGGTPTGQRLDGILREYLKRYEKAAKRARKAASPSKSTLLSSLGSGPSAQRRNSGFKATGDVKPLNIIVVTDGAPTDDVESPLIAAARKLDALDAPAWQVGVQFFQVGDDAVAAEHLRDLDDSLSEIAGGHVRDFVDTVPFQPQTIGGRQPVGRYGEIRELSAEGILKVVLGAVNRRLDRREHR